MNDSSPADEADQRRDPLAAFAELALITVNTDSPERSLHRVAELAKETLGGVEDVSITMIDHAQPQTVVFTGQLAAFLDERQYELGLGPCVDAAKTGQTIVVSHDAYHSPYREFAQIAVRAGVRHTVSLGMPLAQRSVGGLNLYRTTEDPFLPAFLEHAQVFAGYAAVAVNNITGYADAANEATNLRSALESRATIEQAKGILMARDHCSPDEAFLVLRRLSQHTNVKLRDVAQRVVDSAQE